MIFWSSYKLEEALVEGRLSEWDKLQYLMLPAVFSVMFGGPVYLLLPYYGAKPEHHTGFALVGTVLMVLATYYGIRMGYRANQKIDGKCFIERYTILSFPVFVKFLVWLIPGTLTFLAVFGAFTHSAPELRPFVGPSLRIVFPFIVFLIY